MIWGLPYNLLIFGKWSTVRKNTVLKKWKFKFPIFIERTVALFVTWFPEMVPHVSMTFAVQSRRNLGSDGNRWRLNPSFVVLLQPATIHVGGILLFYVISVDKCRESFQQLTI